MSYGVMMSKSAQIMVSTVSRAGEGASDTVLDRFQGIWGAGWVPGRFTVTSLHATFIPNRAGRGLAMMELGLRDIEFVELSPGRMSKTIGLRLPSHVVHVRTIGAPATAQKLAELVAAAKKRPIRTR